MKAPHVWHVGEASIYSYHMPDTSFGWYESREADLIIHPGLAWPAKGDLRDQASNYQLLKIAASLGWFYYIITGE